MSKYAVIDGNGTVRKFEADSYMEAQRHVLSANRLSIILEEYLPDYLEG